MERELVAYPVDFEEYTRIGNVFNDYRVSESDFAITCDYSFLQGLNVGDIIQPSEEQDAPWLKSIELDDDDWCYKPLRVTRKIYSSSSLDVYVVIEKSELIQISNE